MKRKIIIAISGASGIQLGIKTLTLLKQQKNIETHLICSNWAKITLKEETNLDFNSLISLADFHYNNADLGAAIASGSFFADSMLVIPCSMKTLASISVGLADNLISRAADVMLKERKKLVLAVREAPFNSIHLENMLKLSQMGAVIFPTVLTFYQKPKSIDEMLDFIASRILSQIGIQLENAFEWNGLNLKGD